MQQVAAMSILPTTMMKICPVVVSACCTVFILNEPLCFVATSPPLVYKCVVRARGGERSEP